LGKAGDHQRNGKGTAAMSDMAGGLRRQLLLGGVFTAIVVAALITWVDVPLALYFNGYRQTWWADGFDFITDFAHGGIWYPLAVFGIAFAYWRHKKKVPNPDAYKKESRAWLFMIATMLSSGILINAMKVAIGRERPRLLFRQATSDFYPFNLNLSDSSFPSGHTQSIWTAMLCLAFICPPLRPLLFVVAVMVSASRVILGAHYAGDVAASIYIAIVFTLLWKRWFEKDGVSVTLYPDTVRATP